MLLSSMSARAAPVSSRAVAAAAACAFTLSVLPFVARYLLRDKSWLGRNRGGAPPYSRPLLSVWREKLKVISRQLMKFINFRFFTHSTHEKGTVRCIRPSASRGIARGVLGAIGNTPLIRIRSLSEETACAILAKAEFLNPGGSVKDRVALQMVEEVRHGRGGTEMCDVATRACTFMHLLSCDACLHVLSRFRATSRSCATSRKHWTFSPHPPLQQ